MPTKKQIRDYAKLLNPIDDPMFRKMAEEKEFCEEILRTILDDKDLVVLESTPQWTGTNLMGRLVILDAKCITGDGRQMMTTIKEEFVTMGLSLLQTVPNPEQSLKDFRMSALYLFQPLIFLEEICLSIILRRLLVCHEPKRRSERLINLLCKNCLRLASSEGTTTEQPQLTGDRVVRETGKVVENGFTEIYVNTIIDDGSDVAELMKVFSENDSYSDKFPKTSEIKRRYKETERSAVSTLSSFLRNSPIVDSFHMGGL